MPITYAIDPVRRSVLTRAEGLITLADINEHLDVERANQDIDLPELIDARGATGDLTSEEVRQLAHRAASMLRRDGPFGPTAILTDNDVLFGMARMFSVFAETEGVSASAFRDMDAAVAWLDRQTRVV